MSATLHVEGQLDEIAKRESKGKTYYSTRIKYMGGVMSVALSPEQAAALGQSQGQVARLVGEPSVTRFEPYAVELVKVREASIYDPSAQKWSGLFGVSAPARRAA